MLLMMPMTFPTLLSAATQVLDPVVILVLCVAAGIGTVLTLPGRRETPWVKIGGIVVGAAFLILFALLIHYTNGLSTSGMGAYFWVFSAVAIIGALRVITHPRPVYSALYFVLTVMATAGLFVLLWAEFMAAALVLIYAGAILITYVFVIMLAQQAAGDDKPVASLSNYDQVSREPIAAAAIGFALMGVFLFVIFDKAEGIKSPRVEQVAATLKQRVEPPSSKNLTGSLPSAKVDSAQTEEAKWSIQELGKYLMTDQLVSLELAGMILTISMVGAIVIARRRIVYTDAGMEVVETPAPETLTGPGAAINDNPHSIPVYGTQNPRAKAYPES
jgi:NADH-quinone oxidoreductase subunit J